MGTPERWLTLGAAGLAGAAGTYCVYEGGGSAPGLWVGVGLLIGGGFVGAGLVARARRPDNWFGLILIFTGVVWLLSGMSAADAEVPRWTGIVLGQTILPAMALGLLAFPSGTISDPRERLLLIWALFISTVAVFAPGCHLSLTLWGLGPPNFLYLDSDDSFGAAMIDARNAVGGLNSLLIIAVLAARRKRASAPMRRAMAPVLASGMVLAVLIVISFGSASLDLPKDIQHASFLALVTAFGVVPFAFLAGLARSRLTHASAVGSLMAALSGDRTEGDLRPALAGALGDPSLELVYWLPEGERYVDRDGQPVEIARRHPGRAVTTIEREGRRVGALIHDPSLDEEPGLVRDVGAAAGLALENQQLYAEALARAEELQASRARIVTAGDEARRRIERDLHDGAQQRLVALSLALNTIRLKLDKETESEASGLLKMASSELKELLAELRELARGIHPAVLTSGGLAPAFRSLAARCGVPVTLSQVPEERFPEEVEIAAYYTVSEALANVDKYAKATEATVTVAHQNGKLLVEVADNGLGGADPKGGSGLRGLEDRLGAVGGTLTVRSPPGEGTVISAELPV